MKTARLFLVGMYVHLVLSIAGPLGILYFGWGSGWNSTNAGLLVIYIAVVGLALLLGWVSAGAAASVCRRDALGPLLSAWRALKWGPIPFYFLNFLWSFFVWGSIVAASPGIFIFLVPIPVRITWLMVIQSGVSGWLAIRCLRERGKDVFILHSVCRFLPAPDVHSTLLLLRRQGAQAKQR